MNESMNNIMLTHNGVKISVAQHRVYDAEQWVDTSVQEIGVIEDDVSWSDMLIVRYASTLDEFIEALTVVRGKCNKSDHGNSVNEKGE
tara:strand:- start:1008 stop:1271 length:264 start_codon:yes stop_codon:yes gene_type:complete